ncbi:MAG: HD domain-containing protein [Clostridia bacterium]|nr:HD domain-containing protein [Clostridia bacterium]
MDNAYLFNLFNEVQTNNQDASLDNILIACYENFKTDYACLSSVILDDYDLFRTNILKANNIDEYDYYTKNVNPELKKYIENNIFPQYELNDKGHGILHIKEVIRRSFALNRSLNLNLNNNMIFSIASYHDLGKYINHETHEKIAAQKFLEDENMKKFFTDSERNDISQAIEDHRSSFKDTPRTDYGKLISSADRNTRVEIVFIRSFYVGQFRTPNMKMEEYLEFTFNRLSNRYSEENPENMFFEDNAYKNFLKEMRGLLKTSDEEENKKRYEIFKRKYMEVNNISSLNTTLIEEKGVQI